MHGLLVGSRLSFIYKKNVVGIKPKCCFGGYHSQKKVVGIQLKWFSSWILNCRAQGQKKKLPKEKVRDFFSFLYGFHTHSNKTFGFPC